jgi:Flp pilus assembly protein TadB
LVSKVKFMWGIYVLFIGAILAVVGTFLSKKISNFKID